MKRRNLLLLIPDQHRADWVAGGGLPLRTPVLHGLAERGVTFERAYCTSPLCAPSRASLASGRHYAHCGVPDNTRNYPLEQPTFYQALRGVEGRRERHRPVAVAGLGDWRMVTGERHKLVVSPTHPPLLFDRIADEWEDHNLAADRPDVVDELRMHLV